jgi:hypothetical protein
VSESTTAATAASSTAATAAAATTAVVAGTGFVDLQVTAFKTFSVQSSDCSFAFFVVRHLNETESTRPAGHTVGDQA